MNRRIEFIESYRKIGNDYQWSDNHGELVRCKDCKWWFMDENYDGLYRCANDGLIHKSDWYCAGAERKEQNDE